MVAVKASIKSRLVMIMLVSILMNAKTSKFVQKMQFARTETEVSIVFAKLASKGNFVRMLMNALLNLVMPMLFVIILLEPLNVHVKQALSDLVFNARGASVRTRVRHDKTMTLTALVM